jgi:predicted TIM-barrel fold metal-dependent hydrolase
MKGDDVPLDNRRTLGLSRRELLAGLAAAGAAAVLPKVQLGAQQPANPDRFDFHHHFASPRWIARATETKSQGYQRFTDYTPAKSLEAMDKAGVSRAFISITAPGVQFGDASVEETRAMARDANEYGARMVSDYKGRFSLLATMHVPDIEGSLREIEYAFDTLKVDGVGLITSYGNHWLGDPAWAPVFEELNRRKAVVYSHPTDAPCCHDLIPNIGATTIEYNTDTSRAIANILVNGAAGKTPDVHYVFSHGGGTIPYLIERLGVGGPDKLADVLAGTPEPNSRLYHLRRFYYDTAQSANPVQMQALKMVAGASQIVFGADFPYSTIVDHVAGMKKCGFSDAELRGVDRDNVLRFLPKYRT